MQGVEGWMILVCCGFSNTDMFLWIFTRTFGSCVSCPHSLHPQPSW
jgi:hypothetical protein